MRTPALLLFVCACAPATPPAAPSGVVPPDRALWWSAATEHASGRERVLAPRELRALLAEGRGFGFDADAGWWAERASFAWERILAVDPDDVEANAGAGRRTLQAIEGFAPLWERMLLAPVANDAIDELLDRYDVWVQDERPVFLTADEYQVAVARLAEARRHLDRLLEDRPYAALESVLARVRGSVLNDYPHLHVRAGPFLVFYAARDLQRGVEEDEALEDRRIAGRREVYRRRLEDRRPVYEELLDDIRTLYPELWKRHPIREDEFFCQWIFGDRSLYVEFVERIGRAELEAPYRCGVYEGATGWAYLYEPSRPEEAPEPGAPDESGAPEAQLRETAAYLAATQLLRRWAKDPEDPTVNHLDRSRAFWLREGWPSFLAARRVERPMVGRLLLEAVGRGWRFPPLHRVVERRSRLELERYREPPPEFEEHEEEVRPLPVRDAFTDLASLLVGHLNEQERRDALERFLLSQLEGKGGGVEWFEECFRVPYEADWRELERAVYGRIDRKR